MWVCVTVEINRPRKQQQQSFIRNFSRSFVTVPSPTEPGFVCSSVFVTEIHCECVSSVQITACRLECNGWRDHSGCMLLHSLVIFPFNTSCKDMTACLLRLWNVLFLQFFSIYWLVIIVAVTFAEGYCWYRNCWVCHRKCVWRVKQNWALAVVVFL